MPFQIAIFILMAAGVGLVALALSGYGSSDRTHQQHPHLPGHDTQARRRKWEQDHRDNPR